LNKRIIFVTPDSLNENNGGLFLFNTLFKSFEQDLFYWFVCSTNSKNTRLKVNFKKIYYFKDIIFSNNLLNMIARRYLIFGLPWFFIKYKILNRIASFKLVRIIKEHDIEKIWIYTSKFSIPVSKKAIYDTQIKFHLSIQDDINTHLPNSEVRWLNEDFKFLLENAETIDFISFDMESYYRSKYRIKAKSTIFLVSKTAEVDKPLISKKIKYIGYSGNIWCAESFLPLLDSIKLLNKLSTKDLIKVKIFTFHFPRKFFNDYLDIIEFSTIEKYDILIKELQKCDLLYLPMTFNTAKKITNITSFPSKIITYLNAGIPILNHSPVDSSTHRFVVSNFVGVSIVNMEVNSFIKLFNNDNILGYQKRKEFSKFSSLALKHFDQRKMLQNFTDNFYQ
jgi:hypothetical protein